MENKARYRWSKVNVPTEMIELLDRYLQTDRAKERGFTSRTDVAVVAIQYLLDRDGMYSRRPKFEHVNVFEDHVTILDTGAQKLFNIYFRSDRPFCEVCESSKCVHVGFAYSLPEVRTALMDRGVKFGSKILNR